MKYISTRGGVPEVSFREVLLAGLAPDGGLYVPEYYPKVSGEQMAKWRDLSYEDLSFEIISLFVDDIPPATLKEICSKTYDPKKFRYRAPERVGGRSTGFVGDGSVNDITPLLWLGQTRRRGQTKPDSGLALLELSNGPTLAFKDVALQLVGNLFEYVLGENGQMLNILGATSGDTGSAAEYALRGKRGINVFMLSPHAGGMSAFQKAQMYSLQDANIHNIAIRGTFDECQDIVKSVAEEAPFREEYRIGAVNSMNWARIMAQIVYYFKAYLAATKDDGSVNFAVPSGNFGNAHACHVARMMGLPVDSLTIATNENDVLDVFFRTGVYRPRNQAETHITSSPSMDIAKASNLERFMFDVVSRDPGELCRYWGLLKKDGSFKVPESMRYVNPRIRSGMSTHSDRLETIKHIYKEHGTLIDPHTADAISVVHSGILRFPMIVMETAQPCKFADTVREAVGFEPQRRDFFRGLEDLPQRVTVMDPDVEGIKMFIAKHS